MFIRVRTQTFPRSLVVWLARWNNGGTGSRDTVQPTGPQQSVDGFGTGYIGTPTAVNSEQNTLGKLEQPEANDKHVVVPATWIACGRDQGTRAPTSV